MAKITEDFVSFEVAKLLKEKGFNEPCVTQYDKRRNFEYGLGVRNSDLVDNAYKAPTLQMAMKWLREVHNLFVSLRIIDGLYNYVVNDASCYDGVKELEITAHLNFVAYQSPEEAYEVAIKYCLENLI